MNLQTISDSIEITTDYPKQGIVFRDISSLMMNPKVDSYAIDRMIDLIKDIEFDYFAGLDARGFLFKTIADRMKKGFIMIRKGDKLPNSTSISYGTEYSQDKLCISNNFPKNKKIILLDDVLVTGGTFFAAIELIEKVQSNVVCCLSLVELVGSKRVRDFSKYNFLSLLKYDINSKSQVLDKKLNSIKKISEIVYRPLVPNENSEFVVFSHPSMDSVADNLIKKSSKYRRGGIRWDKFSDGTPNITFENEKYLKDKKIIFFMSLYDGDILEQISIMKILPRQDILSLDVYLPFFHVGTMERVNEFGPNQLATADTLSSILSSGMPQTHSGPIKLHIYDLHTLQNRFYFGNDVCVIMETGINLLKKEISKDTVIVFPDDGASKRFGGFFKDYITITCSKKRDGDKRKVVIDDILPLKNKKEKAIIIDDLVQSGGTLEECRKTLLNEGFTHISAYVTHTIFNGGDIREFKFDKFYHTNSNPTISNKLKYEPFHLLNIEDDIDANISEDNEDVKIIYVASQSEIKLNAVYNCFKNSKIYGVNVDSCVSEQPIGDKTHLGAKARLENLKKYVGNKKYDYLISMENGIFMDEDKSFDMCIILVRNENFLLYYSDQDEKFHTKDYFKEQDVSKMKTMQYDECIESDSVLFPKEYFEESQNTGITVGKLMNRDYGYDENSWHHHYNLYTREKLITNAISSCI